MALFISEVAYEWKKKDILPPVCTMSALTWYCVLSLLTTTWLKVF